MKPDLFWIPGPWNGRLAVITRPRGGDWLDDEIAGWRRAGLDVIVSLLEIEEAAQLQLDREEVAARARGMEFLSFPIPDRGVPNSVAATRSLLETIARRLESGKTVAIHCRQGIGRSGLIATASLMTSGISAERAVATVSAARGIQVPETHAQLHWLQHLPTENPAAVPLR